MVFGSRMFLEVTEGQVTGKRLNGRLLSGGGDWIVLGSDGLRPGSRPATNATVG